MDVNTTGKELYVFDSSKNYNPQQMLGIYSLGKLIRLVANFFFGTIVS